MQQSSLVVQDAIELRRRPTSKSVRFSNHAIALKEPSFSMAAATAAAAASPIANGIHTKELDYLLHNMVLPAIHSIKDS